MSEETPTVVMTIMTMEGAVALLTDGSEVVLWQSPPPPPPGPPVAFE